jgi:hypothetical protein
MLTGNKFGPLSSFSSSPAPSGTQATSSDLFLSQSGSGTPGTQAFEVLLRRRWLLFEVLFLFFSFTVSHVSSSGGLGKSSTSASAASIWDNIWRTDDFENNDGGYDKGESLLKDAIVFLVDCNPFMFQPMSSGEIPFVNALDCICKAVTQKLIGAPQDEVAVVLYGTRDQQGDFQGIVVLSDFDKPSAQLIERLDELRSKKFLLLLCFCFASNAQVFGCFVQVPGKYSFGHWEEGNPGTEFALCDAFWTASSLLGRVKNAAERRVWLFTDEDTPHQDEDLLTRAKG